MFANLSSFFLLSHTCSKLVAVHLLDASHITDSSKYISLVLLSLRAMLTLELPHVNVLSKVDLLRDGGDLGEFER